MCPKNGVNMDFVTISCANLLQETHRFGLVSKFFFVFPVFFIFFGWLSILRDALVCIHVHQISQWFPMSFTVFYVGIDYFGGTPWVGTKSVYDLLQCTISCWAVSVAFTNPFGGALFVGLNQSVVPCVTRFVHLLMTMIDSVVNLGKALN